MFFYALGAIGAPLVTSALIGLAGAWALFALISAVHVGLILYGLIRMRARPASDTRSRAKRRSQPAWASSSSVMLVENIALKQSVHLFLMTA